MVVPVVAAIELAFDPYLHGAGLTVPWRAVGAALAILAGLALAAVLARRLALRVDDLLFVAIGVIPGAAIGGRLVHGMVFFEAYRVEPLALADPARGSISLLGAVLGGTLCGAYIASRLEGPVGGWADVAAAPLLLVIGLGKLAQLLAGSGQGIPSEAPWAVAFLGPGPWGSVSPEVPAHPAQVYEASWALAGIPLALALLGRAAEHGTVGLGRVFPAALAWWLAGRIVVASTWRDPHLLGPFNAEQLLALATFALVALVVIAMTVRAGAQEAGPEGEDLTLPTGDEEGGDASRAEARDPSIH
jgi:phosphatidylglycerol:prolipoprotein diacylglycerol transferase